MSLVQSFTSPSRQQQTFEFTKRKRWADLLINELSEAIAFVLSPTCKVLYCGTAVTELLGWRDEDLIDRDFVDLMSLDDQASFRTSFHESVQTRSELLSYVRLICKNQPSLGRSQNSAQVLVELKGYGHFIAGEQECSCFLAVVKPYPGRNAAMLNTFLELKIENERLQQRLVVLRSRPPQQETSSAGPHYSGISMALPRTVPSSMTVSSQGIGDLLSSYYPVLVSSGAYDESIMQRRSSFDAGSLGSYGGRLGSVAGSSSVEDDVTDDNARKKKFKSSLTSDQYVCVTCGRTDSPEWRKGPLGPKTLCNACGLRWAKQVRKVDDGNDTGGPEGSVQGGASSAVPL